MGRGAAPGWVGVYLKGVFMGLADTVPGVSGGTIALITGIYERLIAAITSLDPRVVGYLPRLHDPGARAAVRARLIEMDVAFLLVLLAGILSAVVGLTRVVAVALATYRALTFAFFFGLILASAIVLYGHVSLATPRRLAVAALGFAIAFAVSGAHASGGLPNSPAFAFVAGAIAIAAMVLPGISGAFLLLLLGQYEFLVGVLRRFVDGLVALASGGAPGTVVDSGLVVVSFVAGAAVGLLTVAHVVKLALDRYHAATLTFLVSLMVGALRVPAREVLANTPAWTPAATGATALVAAVGGALVLGLDRATDDLEYT